MAITPYQRTICRLIAAHRISQGESYIAGGVALNTWLQTQRESADVNIFHDTANAVDYAWENDRKLLLTHDYEITIIRERISFVEAVVSKGGEKVILQWCQDSSWRFFPLVTHPDFGLTMHPYDLATSKVLALAGRLEIRDWIDTIHCHHRLQPYGYLVWGACGKDPGFNPVSILAEAKRTARYTQGELDELTFSDVPPDIVPLSQEWKKILNDAQSIIE